MFVSVYECLDIYEFVWLSLYVCLCYIYVLFCINVWVFVGLFAYEYIKCEYESVCECIRVYNCV